MAFTGNPTIVFVSNQLVLIKGLSLGAGAVGTISLSAGAGDVKLPERFQITPAPGVGQADAVEVSFIPVGGVAIANPVLIRTNKTSLPFLVGLTNDDGNATPELEIWLRVTN